MSPYKRMISFVKPHLSDLYAAFTSMFLNSILSGLPVVGLIIPFVDTVLAGKPIVVPNQERIPPFVLDIIYQANSMSRWKLLNLLIVLTVSVSLLRLLFEYLQSYYMNRVSQKVIRDLRNILYSKI